MGFIDIIFIFLLDLFYNKMQANSDTPRPFGSSDNFAAYPSTQFPPNQDVSSNSLSPKQLLETKIRTLQLRTIHLIFSPAVPRRKLDIILGITLKEA